MRSVAVLLAVLWAGCGTPGPRSLAYGAEECAHCHMTLVDPRFSAALVTATGRTIPFDDVGCLGAFVATGGMEPSGIHSVWVADYLAADEMIAADQAVFLATDRVQTPMRYGMIATAAGRADSLRAALDGVTLTWPEVVTRTRAGSGP